MLRIRKISDARSPANRSAIEEAQAILQSQFPGIGKAEMAKLPEQLENPFKHGFVAELYVAEGGGGHLRAIAILLHDPVLKFSLLEFISTALEAKRGSGVGGVLYERLREEALAVGSAGLYFECLPDDPALCPDPKVCQQNAARLKFYERYRARPIIGTEYQLPVRPGDTNMPFLVFDGLGRHELPKAAQLRRIVRAILERQYSHLCSPEYVQRVAASIRDGAFALREPRYVKPKAKDERSEASRSLPKFPLLVNERHDIHHVRERGYVEAPVRVPAILAELEKTGLFQRMPAKRFPDRFIREVHDAGLLRYIETACREAPLKKSVYPYVFPIRNPMRRPKEKSVLAGYWCIDTFTPLNRNAWPAARQAADCSLTAALQILNGMPAAYALVRPPGHHAERRAFGGFCYLCNVAIAANYLAKYGRVAILDIDYHHGNGQQDIFYERADVLTVSIHGHPSFAYPYFSGFRDEAGRGPGAGYNLNLPLPETITPDLYRDTLKTALRRIERHRPSYLVVALGLDTARGDPTGTWSNQAADFRKIGRLIGDAGYPTLVVQEGGYRVRTLGGNAREFFLGLAEGLAEQRQRGRKTPLVPPTAEANKIVWREAVRERDVEPIRRLVAATGMFSVEEIEIAVELAEERIAKGRRSGYEFITAERSGRLHGYACYGPIPGSETAYDLYWIAVDPDRQGQGLGREILVRAEAAMHRRGARQVHVDTSSTERYARTRAFYLGNGYEVAAELPDFYRPGDGKVIFVKHLDRQG